ncbi:hypothetical protein VMCG_08429 [Cytospora schulzeri]|uniref:Uncharacterized protein n=1 Tax=Cytospora schulzeri TaxID=448051 RepID=A0A423VQQ4_9PEZI|nr:hypothetical protein VMCG_08429 [Valsa malicola]
MSVRNLRAMFETKPQESPPDRGRSPAESSTDTNSPRRLSKVRTSFVAIEKDGRIGLQRNSSEASSVSGRKLSGDTEATSSVQLDNTATNVPSPTNSRSDLNRGPASAIPSSSPQRESGHSPAGGDTTSTNSSGPQGSIPGDPRGPTTLTAGRQAVLAESPQIRQGTGRDRESQSPKSSGGRRPDQGGKTDEKQAAPADTQGESGTEAEGVNQGGDKAPTDDSTSRGTSGSAAVNKPVNGVDKTKAIKPAAGTAQKTANTQPVKSSMPVSQSKPANKPAERKSRRSTTPTADKKATGRKPPSASVSPEGFVKPRPRSPTRPAKLPASLTTHTAASGSKARAVSGPAHAPAPAPATAARPTSRSSANSGTASKGMRRSSSVAARQRPSLGPPPKLPAKDHPLPKKESKVDEGFLARMMRPTQAYANKVNEKVPTTPPRRPAATSKRPASAKRSTSRKPASRITSAATSAAASPETERKPDPSAAKRIVPVVEQTPIAEEEIAIAEKEEVAIPETPKTPEHEPTIMEEKEENTEDLPVASAAPEASNEPDVEEADAPLANGHNHKEESEEKASLADPKGEVKIEKEPASEPVSSGAVEQVQAQEKEEQEEEL